MENIKDYRDFQRAVRELEGPWYADSNCVFFDKDTNTFRAFYQPDPNQPAELEIRFTLVFRLKRTKMIHLMFVMNCMQMPAKYSFRKTFFAK